MPTWTCSASAILTFALPPGVSYIELDRVIIDRSHPDELNILVP